MRLPTLCFSLLLVFLLVGCNRKVNPSKPIVADITLNSAIPGAPDLSGKLYLKNGHLRVDFGKVVGLYDLKQRKGVQLVPELKEYTIGGDKELSTYFPQMINGSLCPDAELPSECKQLGKEEINRRIATKWAVFTSKGFYVYYWTDDATGLTLRLEIGKMVYQATNLRNESVSDAMFEHPAGYQQMQANPWRTGTEQP